MISKVTFGTPFRTDAITQNVEKTEKLTHFSVTREKNSLIFTCKLTETDIVYGLGETTGRVNKRGGRYISFNTDTADHSDANPSLYAAHNLLIVEGSAHFGAFFDTPGRVIFEIDYKNSGQIRVICETENMAVYQLEHNSAYELTREFLKAIGPCYLPPLWAFGYGQSRFGYKDEGDIRDVVRHHRKENVPLDYVCMDIDYMDRYIDFTVNPQNFPDLSAFSAEMRGENVHLVPIVDAGIKVEPGNEVYESGVKRDVFCRNKDGGLFQAAVWPGMTHFPDFLDADARAWFGEQYKFYTDRGIEGFWNDMNEPAIFYSEYTKGPKKSAMLLDFLFGKFRKAKKEQDMMNSYRSFYHKIDGKSVCHYDVHNLFGMNMTRATAEGLDKLLDHRYMLFSRSSCIGASRYGGVWTGDNSSCWEHLLLNLRHMASLNMCGFLFSGADTGGFCGNTTRELLLRWLAVSAFTPLMRNHCGKFMKDQEFYRFENSEDFRSIISLRYRLLPYIYSEYMKAALTGDMYIKPVQFAFPEDEKTRNMEDQLMVGSSLMIAPIITEGAVERKVYLPEDMTMVKYDGENFTCTDAQKGEMTIHAELNEAVFFIRKGKLLPVGKAITSTAQIDFEDLQLLGDGETYHLYSDDGLTRDCSMNNVRVLRKD